MSFQTNKQTSIKIIGSVSKPNCPSSRSKTCLSEYSDPDQSFKRFQRSNTKMLPNSSTSSLLNKPSGKSYDTQINNQIPLAQSKVNQMPPMVRSVGREPNLDQSQIMNQKYIPFTMRQLKIQQNSQVIQTQPYEKLYDSRNFGSTNSQVQKKQLITQKSEDQLFPFKTILNCSSVNELKSSQLIIEPPRKQSTSIFEKESPRNRLKTLFEKNHTKTVSYCEIANTSTQSSIPETSRMVKKVACASQTESKKCIHFGVNTINVKTISVKVQTEQKYGDLQKNIDDLKNKLAFIEAENKKLKFQLSSSLKQKQNLSRLVKQVQSPGDRSYKSISIHKSPQSNMSKISSLQSQQPSFKQISLQGIVASLNEQIQTLKTGLGLKKTEEILEAVKRQNVALANQLQAVSLKCRVLEQNNNELCIFQQESRKLKLEIKYFRGSIKDHQIEIERLKGEIKKIRNMPKMNGIGRVFEQSRVISGWGSETDSLNLSVSLIRD